MTGVQKYLIESVVKDVTFFAIRDFDISVSSAFSLVYNSETVSKLFDFETGLYYQSSMYIYDMFLQEIKMGKVGKEY